MFFYGLFTRRTNEMMSFSDNSQKHEAFARVHDAKLEKKTVETEGSGPHAWGGYAWGGVWAAQINNS